MPDLPLQRAGLLGGKRTEKAKLNATAAAELRTATNAKVEQRLQQLAATTN